MADEMNTDERAKFEEFLRDAPEAVFWNTTDAMMLAFHAGRAQGFRDGVASLSAAEPAGDAIFEFWWADHMPNATQSEAWAEWCALRSNQPAEPAPALTQGAAIAAGAVYAELPKDVIRAVFIENGFTVKDGQTDLKQYVYDAADELLRRARLRAPHGQAPAQPAALPFGYFHQLLNHEGEGNGVWLGTAKREVVEQSHTPGETGEEIVALYTAPTPSPQAAQQAPTTFGGCPECGFKSCVARQCTRPGPSALTNIAAQQAPAGDESKALAALRYYRDECSGAEPSISVFHRMLDEALATPAAPSTPASPTIEGESNV